jgi:2-dehydropantoate 2-reductase
MKIAVLGAGSLGCAMGGVLAEHGNEVFLINRSQARVDHINAHGLILRTGENVRTVRLQAATHASEVGRVDLVIVLVKSFHTREAISSAAALLGPETVVLTLQNGVGHEEILAEYVGAERIVSGKSYVGGLLLGLGDVIAGTVGKETIIGEPDGARSPRIEAIAAAFNAAGLKTIVSSNIQSVIWDKVLVNAATGPLSAITRLPYGELYKMSECETTAIAAVSEGMSVARAAGVMISFQHPREPWLKAGTGLPYEFKTSMLQSIEKGSITEIDFINGAICKLGRKWGVATPVNDTLVASVKGIEQSLKTAPQV